MRHALRLDLVAAMHTVLTRCQYSQVYYFTIISAILPVLDRVLPGVCSTPSLSFAFELPQSLLTGLSRLFRSFGC